LTAVLAWGVVMLAAFLALGILAADRPSILDTAVTGEVGGTGDGPFGGVVAVVSDALGPVLPVVALVLLVAAMLREFQRGRPARAELLLRGIGLLVACRLLSLFKLVYERERPTDDPDYADFSYPSGHVVSMASVALTAIVLCAWLAPWLLRATIALSVLLVALSAACRVLLGVHWLTDVLGAVLGVTGVGLLAALALRLLPVAAAPVETERDEA
jgi:membrane-associated phospholipid phosphatase